MTMNKEREILNTVIVFGATSTLAKCMIRQLAETGSALYLVARNKEKLQATCDDAIARGARLCSFYAIEFDQNTNYETIFDQANKEVGVLDTCIIAHGTLSDQQACEASEELMLEELDTNMLSYLKIMRFAGNLFSKQKRGMIIPIMSVAGDRGRQSNYLYGTAKAAVATYASGQRNRLHTDGVHVLTVKPGFIDTAMTAHLKKGLLWAQPETVASAILKAAQKRVNILYVPFFWRYIMFVIKAIPEQIFKRLKL